jgi:hypothetical protein
MKISKVEKKGDNIYLVTVKPSLLSILFGRRNDILIPIKEVKGYYLDRNRKLYDDYHPLTKAIDNYKNN